MGEYMKSTLNELLEALNTRCVDVDRAAESLGVAALAVGTGGLTPQQMRLIARGLVDVQGDLHDLSESLRMLANHEPAIVGPSF
jgi:hypothetical protein